MPHSLVSHRHLISCLLPTKDQPVKPGRQPQSEIICWISNLERKLLQGQIFQIGLVFWQMHQVEIPLVSVSSQFDDIQIPSEVFSAVVKSASTGCLKIEFCKNWAFTDPASDWGKNTFNFSWQMQLYQSSTEQRAWFQLELCWEIICFWANSCFSAFFPDPLCPLYPVSAKRPIKALNMPIQSMILLDLPQKSEVFLI